MHFGGSSRLLRVPLEREFRHLTPNLTAVKRQALLPHECSPNLPGAGVVRIQLQDDLDVAKRIGALPGRGGPHGEIEARLYVGRVELDRLLKST